MDDFYPTGSVHVRVSLVEKQQRRNTPIPSFLRVLCP